MQQFTRSQLYQICLNNQIIVGAGLGISFGQDRKLDIKTRPYRFYGHLTGFDITRREYPGSRLAKLPETVS